MNKTHYLIVIFLSSISLVGQQPWPEIKNRSLIIKPSQFTLNGITILSKVNEVQAALGTPDSISLPIISEVTGDSCFTYYYNGIKIYINGGKVFNLKCTTQGYYTSDSIQVSSTIEEIKKRYGDVYSKKTDEIRLYANNIEGILIIRIKDYKVIEIELWFDYT